MKKTQFNNKKQDLLQKKVMYSLLAAGFFCSIGIASTAVAAVASEKVINGDMPSGLETNTEYVNITGGSRITGTVKVINDADNIIYTIYNTSSLSSSIVCQHNQ